MHVVVVVIFLQAYKMDCWLFFSRLCIFLPRFICLSVFLTVGLLNLSPNIRESFERASSAYEENFLGVATRINMQNFVLENK